MEPPAWRLRATVLPFGDAPADLWIVGGRIRTRPVADARPLAPPGGFALPGLADAHVHLSAGHRRAGLPAGSRELVDHHRRRQLEAGVLLLRDMGALRRREAARPATLGLPRDDGLPPVLASGQPLAPPGVFTGIQEPAAPADLAALARRRAARDGAPWVKVILDNFPSLFEPPDSGAPGMANYGEAELRAAADAVHAAGARLAVHAFGREACAAAVAAGADSIEHGWGLDEGSIEDMARRGIAWTPTLCLDAMLLGTARGERDRAPSPAVERWLREAIGRTEPLVARAQRAGVALLAGTDGIEPLAREIARLREAGLTPAESLAAASSGARAALGEPGIEDGAPADLLWFAADPRESPELLARPGLVLLRGEPAAPRGG